MFLPMLSVVSGLKFGLDHVTPFAWGIIGLLALLSTISWATLLMKWFLLSRTQRANRRFLSQFHDSPHPLALFLTKEQVDFSPLYFLYHAASRDLAFHLVGEEEPGRSFSARLQGAGRISPSQMSTVQNSMERAVGSTALKLELRLGLVATVISVAPLVGILGTVVGLLEVFAALADQDQASLAPGVSSALITTITALLVVIPSLVGYNLVVNRIRQIIVRMDNFASELSGIFDKQFVDHRKVDESLPSLSNLGPPAMPMPSSTGSATRAPART
jgi:biopolymer transport protein ExbB/TolQ